MIKPAEDLSLVWDSTSHRFEHPSATPRAQVRRLVLVDSVSKPVAADLDRAHALLAKDPRVVSVSGISPEPDLDPPPVGRHSGDAGTPMPWILLDLSSADLVGDPRLPDGSVTASTLAQWAETALSRGLRHAWLLDGAPGVLHAQGPMWPPADRPDERDPLSPAHLYEDQIRARGALSIAVDARWLGPHETGAQVAATRLLEALAARSDVTAVHLHDLPGGKFPSYAARLRASDKVRLTQSAADVFWRPAQPDDGTLMSLDRAYGRRVVVTILDLIEFSNPAYSANPGRWAMRRERLRRYLRQADMVTGISQDVLDHVALEVPGIEAQRLVLTPLGIDQPSELIAPGRPPDALVGQSGPYLLVLGSDYRHKNRDFAIRVWRKVAEVHDVDLVLAGLNLGIERSTTQREEAQLTSSETGPRGRIHQIMHVDAEEKSWLLQHAAVLLYPTSAEGFGFLPHEAAAVGVPAVFTAFGPLAEHFAGVGGPMPWNVAQYADRVSELMSDTSERARTVSRQAAAGRNLTWPSSAEQLMYAFRRALLMSSQPYGLWERSEGAVSVVDPNERLVEADARQRARELSRAPLLDRLKRRTRNLRETARTTLRRRRSGSGRS